MKVKGTCIVHCMITTMMDTECEWVSELVGECFSSISITGSSHKGPVKRFVVAVCDIQLNYMFYVSYCNHWWRMAL